MKMTDIIRKRRKELELTQREFADLLHISSKTVSRWESGVQLPDVTLLPEIARVLGITVNELYGINDNNRKTINVTNKAPFLSKTAEIKVESPLSRKVLRIYRLISIVGVVIALLGGIWLCVNDALRMSLADKSDFVRLPGYIMFYGGIIVEVINQIWFTAYSCKKGNENFVYHTTAFKTGGAVFILIFVMASIMMPLWIGFPLTEVYAVVCVLSSVIMQGWMLAYYRKYAQRGVILKRWIPIITSAVLLITVSGYTGWMLHGALTALWAQNDGTLAYYSTDRLQIVANIIDMTHRFNYFGSLCVSGLLSVSMIITYAYLVKKINDNDDK